MDISDTLAPTSDQLDAVDLLGGPRTFTIAKVSRGNAEQPVQLHLAEFPRPWRPGKSMRRVLVDAWGKDSAVYAGRRLTLYRDPEVRFGADKVGGIKISHLSHIDRGFSLALTETRGKRKPHAVEPLPDVAPARHAPTREDIAACTDVDRLRAWAETYQGARRDAALARIDALTVEGDPWAGGQ